MAYPPMIKPSRKGLLHKKLGVPQDQKIPESKLAAAKRSKSPAERKEATFAENFGHGGSRGSGGGGSGKVPTGGHHQANHREPRSHSEFEKMGDPGKDGYC